jgi:mRNA interferase MazF
MKRGEVWSVNLNPTVGAEIHKTRPAVIMSDDTIGILPLKVIVPITEWNTSFARYVWMVSLIPTAQNGLGKRSAADTFQVRSVSHDRFVSRQGALSSVDMHRIERALLRVLKI